MNMRTTVAFQLGFAAIVRSASDSANELSAFLTIGPFESEIQAKSWADRFVKAYENWFGHPGQPWQRRIFNGTQSRTVSECGAGPRDPNTDLEIEVQDLLMRTVGEHDPPAVVNPKETEPNELAFDLLDRIKSAGGRP